jgi:hypothetical protein
LRDRSKNHRENAHPREKRDLARGLIEELMAVAAEIHEA